MSQFTWFKELTKSQKGQCFLLTGFSECLKILIKLMFRGVSQVFIHLTKKFSRLFCNKINI